jgi:hypothetical protein
MYGLTSEEIQELRSDLDREEDGLTALERRAIINAARAGNTAALRMIEKAYARAGASRSVARADLAELRALGPVSDPENAESARALADLTQFLKGLK